MESYPFCSFAIETNHHPHWFHSLHHPMAARSPSLLISSRYSVRFDFGACDGEGHKIATLDSDGYGGAAIRHSQSSRVFLPSLFRNKRQQILACIENSAFWNGSPMTGLSGAKLRGKGEAARQCQRRTMSQIRSSISSTDPQFGFHNVA